jgi:hypothetical protein
MVNRVSACGATTFLAIAIMSGAALAQDRPAPPRPAPGKPEPAARPADVKRRNVNIEVAITDQTGTGEPVRKVVTMIVADRQMGSIRSSGNLADSEGREKGPFTEARNVILNVDASPFVHADDSVLLTLTLEYVPRPDDGQKSVTRAQLNERLAVTLETGKPLVISRAADPAGNRSINIAVTATVMK